MSKITPFSLPKAAVVTPKQSGSRPLGVISPSSRTAPASVSTPTPKDPAQRLRELEARLTILETAMIEHATVLRDRIGERLDRLEQKFRYEADGLRRALATESSDRKSNIIELARSVTAAVDRVESNQQTSSVENTMQDLVSALADTRTHLDGLTRAVGHSNDGLAS